jgi:hypothetical protein
MNENKTMDSWDEMDGSSKPPQIVTRSLARPVAALFVLQEKYRDVQISEARPDARIIRMFSH